MFKAIKAFWTGDKPADRSLLPPPPEGEDGSAPKASRADFILISVIGMEPTARDQMLDWMVEDCNAKGKTPVFITDDLDLTPWIERRLLIEHLPSLERQANLAPDLGWDLYLNRRLDQIKRKWRSADIADLGQKLDEIKKLGSGDKIPAQPAAVEPIERQG